MNAYADGFAQAWDVATGSGELLFEHADAAMEWVAEAGWASETGWESEAAGGMLEWAPSAWPELLSERFPPNGEAIPVAAIIPALTQLAPLLLQAAPAILGAVNAAMPALQGLLQGFARGTAPAAVTRGREMASETAVLESTLAAMESLLSEGGVEAAEGTYPNALVEPPESRFAYREGEEFLPALAGIVAALAPVVGQVISAATSRRPARATPPAHPPARPPVQPLPGAVPMPAAPSPTGAAAGSGAQALALLPQLMPLLTQLATQLAASPGGGPGAVPPAGDPGLGMPVAA